MTSFIVLEPDAKSAPPSERLWGQKLSAFQRFCVAMRNIPKEGRFLGEMTVIDTEEAQEKPEYDRPFSNGVDNALYSALDDLVAASSFCCGGEIHVRPKEFPKKTQISLFQSSPKPL